MPWVGSDDQGPGTGLIAPPNQGPIQRPEPEPQSGMDIMNAALRQGNSVVSAVQMMRQNVFPAEEGHNSLDNIRGTRFYDDYADRFLHSHSNREDYAIISQIQQEEADKQTLKNAGNAGWVSIMLAGLADPTMLLPGGVGVDAAKEGLTFTKAALRLGAASAAQVAAQESVFQATQLTRPGSESALNVGAGTLMGAFLGAGAVKFMTAAEATAIQRGMERERAEMNIHAGNPDLPNSPRAYDLSQAARVKEEGNVIVNVDLNKVHNELHAIDRQGYVPDKRQAAQEFVAGQPKEWNPPQLNIRKHTKTGEPVVEITDGIHRWAAMRDLGLEVAPVEMTPAAAKQARELGLTREPIAYPEAEVLPPERAGGMGAPMPAAAGAAAVDTRQLERVPIFGPTITRNAAALTSLVERIPIVGGMTARALRAAPDLMDRMDPMSRIFSSRSLVARRATADAFETVVRFGQNLVGLPTVLGGGGALSRLAHTHIAVTRHKVAVELNEQWKDMKYGADKAPFMARTRDALDNMVGSTPRSVNELTFEQFKGEVSHAMRNDDKHATPQVQKAAEFIRAEVFDPILKRAQDAGIIDKDIEPKFAQSYLQRIYDKQKILSNKPGFANDILSHLKSEQTDKRAAQERMAGYNEQLQRTNAWMDRLQERLDRNLATQRDLSKRLAERAMEVGRTGRRVGTLEELSGDIAQEMSEIQEFIGQMRGELKDPQQLARLDQMQKDVSELRRQDRPMTEAQLRDLEDEEVKSALTGPYRAAARMIVGQEKYPKAPSFLSWLILNGGLKDTGGDVASTIGGHRVRPGLINSRGRAFDQMGEKIQNEFPGQFPTTEDTGHGAPDQNQILDWISESSRGHEPAWWVESLSKEDKDKLEAGKIAGVYDEMFNRAGFQPKSVADVGKIFRDEFSQSVSLRDLDAIAADMERAGQSVPVSIRRQGAEDELAIAHEDVAKVRQLIASAQAGNAARLKRMGATDIRAGEAALAERANRGRLGLLEDRLDRHEQREQLIREAMAQEEQHRGDIRAKLEHEAEEWDGRSSVEAKRALKSRARQEERTDRGEAIPEGKRLTTADPAVDAFVKKVLASNRDLSDQELRPIANEIVDHIVGSPDGRLNYDIDSGGPQEGFTGDRMEGKRGSELARTLGIPDSVLEPWLENDIETIVGAHLHTMVPDILLTERFGDPLMTNEFRKINEEYSALQDQEKDPAKRMELSREQNRVIRDLAGMRDIFRGVYGMKAYADNPNLARTAAAIKNINVPLSLGMSTISSLPDLGNVMARFGVMSVMKDAYLPLIRSLAATDLTLTKEVTRQLQAMGICLEMEQASRLHSIADIVGSTHARSRFERTLQAGATKFQLLNLQAPWTDVAKGINGMVAMQELFHYSERWAAGTATKREIAILGENSITPALADKIAKEYRAHGQDVGGVFLTNTGDWTDKEALSAFQSAVGRETDIGVVTPGFEKPLTMAHPVYSVLTQFKSFTMGAHQRILIANLQRQDAQTMGGVFAMMALGMLSYKIGAALKGEETSDNPADWIKEGMSRGNIMGWLEEGNQMAARSTRGVLDAYRIIGSEKPLSRYAGRSAVDQLLGPTAGKLAKITQISGALASRDWKESDTHAVRTMTAFQNLFYLRQMYDQIERGANDAFGIKQKAAD